MTNTKPHSRQKPMAISSITLAPTSQSDHSYFHHTAGDFIPTPTCGNKKKNCDHSSSSGDENGPLSLHERRIRNKTASAKYRAKKNQQYHEMRSMILSLTKENDVLIRQFEQLKADNRYLKSECDKFRSKMLAARMLKKMLNHQSKYSLSKSNIMELDMDNESDDQGDSFLSGKPYV